MRPDIASNLANVKAYRAQHPNARLEDIAAQFGFSYSTARRLLARIPRKTDPLPLQVPLTIGRHTYLIAKL